MRKEKPERYFPFVEVMKSARVLVLHLPNGSITKFRIALGRVPVGHKQCEGDGKTPEGIYYIYDKNPNSKYYLNAGISYPNICDLNNARKMGRPAGGDIKIHGIKNGTDACDCRHPQNDWTEGCIALLNEEMQILYDAIPVGTIIAIRP